MRKLFIQFYLLLVGCFLLMALLIGAIYMLTAERAMDKSLDDLMQGALSLLRSELRHTPPEQWQQALSNSDSPLSFDIAIEPLEKSLQHVEEIAREPLKEGDIIMLEGEDRFLQRVPDSDYVMVVGPISYLSFLREMRLFDFILLGLLGLSLAIPVFLWMRPHWRSLLMLEKTAYRLGKGDLSARSALPPESSLHRLGAAFDQMADNLQQLIAGRKRLTDGIAHELRTPLVRLRYRIELSGSAEDKTNQGMIRDISALESLIDEMLIYARLDTPMPTLECTRWNANSELEQRMQDWLPLGKGVALTLFLPDTIVEWCCDKKLILRAIDNLITNALRHANQRIEICLDATAESWILSVDDDGPGIPLAEREHVFEPFVRLDQSRSRATGGHGLGLALVRGIMHAHKGSVSIEDSPLGGARFILHIPLLNAC